MLKKMKSCYAGKIYLVTIIVIMLTTQVYSQTKSVKVLLDDATTRYYPVGAVTKLTFEDDACDGIRTVIYASKSYTTVQIGSQCWMEQNLDVGTMIHTTSGGTNNNGEQTNNSSIEKYCYNDEAYICNLTGGLYQWDEAMNYSTTEGAQGICPTGWHIPTNTQRQALVTSVSSSGNALKSEGQSGVGTNTSGFSALLAGRRADVGYFRDLGRYTYFYSSTQSSSNNAYGMILVEGDFLGFTNDTKNYGYSIRCLKD